MQRFGCEKKQLLNIRLSRKNERLMASSHWRLLLMLLGQLYMYIYTLTYMATYSYTVGSVKTVSPGL